MMRATVLCNGEAGVVFVTRLLHVYQIVWAKAGGVVHVC